MKTPIMDTPFEVKTSQVDRRVRKASFLPHLQASQAYHVNCMLNQCRQLGSCVRELNDKYPGSCICLSQCWNREWYTIMLTVGAIILEHLTSGVVLKLFWLAKVKSIMTGPSFVGIMRLVTGLSEGKERLQLRNVWST